MWAIRIKQTQRRNRRLLLSVLPIELLAMLGAAEESLDYDHCLKAKTVKYRTHSSFRRRLMIYKHIPN